MPATSEKQREMFAIAEHKPDILYDRNKKVLGSMSKGQMHDFASTKGLKKDKPKVKKPASMSSNVTPVGPPNFMKKGY